MNNNYNPLLDADSYNHSFPEQYIPGATEMFSYASARGSSIPGITSTQFFGLQYYMDEYLRKPITTAHIDEAEALILPQGEPFNRKDWEYIVKEWGGYAPIIVKAVPEGLNTPVGVPLITVKSLDPKVFWAPGHYEAPLLRAAWYGTTVATISKAAKNNIYEALVKSSDDPAGQIPFKLHDFGARGVSSFESSMIGGAAHLTNGFGSDTLAAIPFLKKYYRADQVSFSIPASQHATITSWGKEGEVEAYRNMIKKFGLPGKYFACVSDSYDIFNAVDNIWGRELKQEVIDSGATLVIRPDSGKPVDIVMYCLRSLEKTFGFTVNTKGYKVLKNVRVIQGDGVNLTSIQEILDKMLANMFSIDNIAFGMGGALLQKVDRDTFKFAMKCSHIRANGVDIDVFKDPITDNGKSSLKGEISTYYNTKIGYYCDRIKNAPVEEEVMQVVYDGMYPTFARAKYSLDEIRQNTNQR